MALKIVRKPGEGIVIRCGAEELVVVVEKSSATRCSLNFTGARSIRVERLEKGTRNDYGSAKRSTQPRAR